MAGCVGRGIGLDDVAEWGACLVELDLGSKHIGQRRVGLGIGQLQGALGRRHRFGKPSALGISSRQRAENHGILAAG